MSKKQRFTKEELEEFKKRLVEMRIQHKHAFEGTSSDVKMQGEARGVSQHHADEGTDDFGRTISIQVTSQELSVIKQIDRALEKIDEGTFGVCDISGEDIPKKRLEAIPYATMTVKAQEDMEKGA